jgi:hypothetical protein
MGDSKHSLGEFLQRSWSLFVVGLTVGVILMVAGDLWEPENPHLRFLPKLLEHIGTAFVVATLVAMFFHLREFSEFFTSLAAAVLTQDTYLRKLKKDALLTLRVNAVQAIMETLVDNPEYDREDFLRSLDEMLFRKLLPAGSQGAGVYRENLVFSIVMEYMTLGEALDDVGEKNVGVPEGALKSVVVKQTTHVSYDLVLPSTKMYGPYKHPTGFETFTADIPHFPVKKRVGYRVGCTAKLATDQSITITADDGKLKLTGSTILDCSLNQPSVWTELVEYRSPVMEPFIFNRMSMLTHKVTVNMHYKGAGPPLTFYGDIFGVSGEGKHVDPLGGAGLILSLPGWLLEDHGFFVWWWDSKEGTATHRNGSEDGVGDGPEARLSEGDSGSTVEEP